MKDFLKYTGATIVGLLIFSFISTLLSVISMLVFMVSIMSGVDSQPVKIAEHSVLCIDLKGSVVERSNVDEFEVAMLEAMGQTPDTEYGLNDLLDNIARAKDDPKIDGIYLRGGQLSMGTATAQELRRALVEFKQSGKFVLAYADSYGQNNYYLASCAEPICLNAIGSLDWKGLSLNLDFYSRLLEKIGVEMQVVKVGTFKSAVEPFILTGMSDANRLQYTVLANDIWQERLEEVSASRNISIDQLNLLADSYMSLRPEEEYITSGLIDSLCYPQDIDSILTTLCGTKDYSLVSHSSYLSAANHDSSAASHIAILYAQGNITDESGDGIVGKDMVETINELADDDDIAAVVLRVNSGGGSAYASEQIHHALSLLREKKPLVVSMGDYAASGGYYISCPADFIFAERTTLTGSIGIFGLVPNLSRLADNVGIDFDGVKTNAHSDLETNMVLKGMNPEERAMLQEEINRGYELFTLRCAEGRNIPQDSIKAIGEGRVWSGIRALNLGLVDSLGNVADAVLKAQQLADLADCDYDIVEYPEKEDMLTTLLNSLSASVRLAISPAARAERLIENRLGHETYEALRYMEQLEAEPTIQARIPYIIDIR